MGLPYRARVDERWFLNLPGFHGGAYVVAYVEDTRERALQALVNLSQDDKILAEFLPEFRAALADKGTRQTFVRYLAARHNSEANLVALASELRKLLNEDDIQVRHATVQLLARIQYGKADVLLQAFDTEPSAARRAEICRASSSSCADRLSAT